MGSLKNHFDFESNGFFGVVDLEDVYDGFDVYKALGRDGFFSIFSFYITEDDFNAANDKKAITIIVNNGKFKNGELITSSTTIKTSTFDPICIISKKQYFFDSKTEEFYKKNKKTHKKICPHNILSEVENLHIKPTKMVVGFGIRFKLFFWLLSARLFYTFYKVFSAVLFLVDGTKTKNIYWGNLYPETVHENDFKDREKGNLLGYKASYWAITSYSILHIFIFLTFYVLNIRPSIIRVILTYNFITGVYIVSSVYLYEHALPYFLKFLLIKLARGYLFLSKKI